MINFFKFYQYLQNLGFSILIHRILTKCKNKYTIIFLVKFSYESISHIICAHFHAI